MEGDSKLGQKGFPVLPAEPFVDSILDGAKEVADQFARLSCGTRKRQLVVFRLVVVLLLLCEKLSDPSEYD